MNFSTLLFAISTTCFVSGSKLLAAPGALIQSGETTAATWSAIAGTLQVQVDKTTFDAKTKQMHLQGNVVLTQKDARGRLSTLRTGAAVLASPDAEFQITQKTYTEFEGDDQSGRKVGVYVDVLRHEGHQAGFVESTLRAEIQRHGGFSSYRLRFSGVGASAANSGIVLYNRRMQTLKIYRIFNYPGAGILEITDQTYRGVSDVILFKALDVKDENGQFRRDPSGQIESPSFGDLKKYGVTLSDISRRFRFQLPQ